MQSSDSHTTSEEDALDMSLMSNALPQAAPLDHQSLYSYSHISPVPTSASRQTNYASRPTPIQDPQFSSSGFNAWGASGVAYQQGNFSGGLQPYGAWSDSTSFVFQDGRDVQPHMVGRYTRPGDQEQGKQRQLEPSTSSLSHRGPPRKPRRSGHALWVGNLPPFARVTDVKDHFSAGATRDIESVFLISKTNCAFVNYRTEAACIAAAKRFHHTRLRGRSLACRLQKSPIPSILEDTEPVESLQPLHSPTQPPDAPASEAIQEPSSPVIVGDERTKKFEPLTSLSMPDHKRSKAPERFFILKSLTLQDLEASRVTNMWATQPHNEESLRQAYAEAKAVYLIFSANKSGEYYGYAQMISAISQTPVVSNDDSISPAGSSVPHDFPMTFTTPATGTAPRGQVVDDSGRGTIFWEAIHSDNEDEVGSSHEEHNTAGSRVQGTFGIRWISTRKVTFHRTRGMRNPWNGHKEIKIARDGTELETQVGKRLLRLFHTSV